MNILSDGEVCLEFIKPQEGQEKVVEVLRISAEGKQVGIDMKFYRFD